MFEDTIKKEIKDLLEIANRKDANTEYWRGFVAGKKLMKNKAIEAIKQEK